MKLDLGGKRALVTGGSGSIGRAIGAQLAAAGADVALTYMSDREGAEVTAQAIREAGGRAQVIKANFADAESTQAVAKQIEGSIDLLISNAASGVLRPTAELADRHWQWTMDVNARALLRLVRSLTLADGGRVVAISSLGGHRAIPQYGAVGASKAALEALVRQLAYELGPRGITANAVSPGIVKTRALDFFPNRDELIDVATRKTPAGRLTTPEDVAGVVAFLCSETAAMINGQTIHVDGGYAAVA